MHQLLKAKRLHSTQGFTLIEVLVAILIIVMFTSVGMTGVSLAAVFKLKAKTKAQATTWILTDLEAVKNQADQFSYSLSASAAAGQPVLPLTAINGLAVNEQIIVGTDSTIYTIQSISGNAVTLTANLSMAQAASTTVVAFSKCNATTTATGFASSLQPTLPALNNGGSQTLAGQPYTLSRSITIRNTAPYPVLQLSYQVAPQSGGPTSATLYSEVIPHAVYQCPQPK